MSSIQLVFAASEVLIVGLAATDGIETDDEDDKLQVDGWENNGWCRRTLSGAGNCRTGGHY